MELVINVSEEDYKTLMNMNDDRLPSIIARKHLYNALANGTPLPKGHGRLIDADALKETFIEPNTYLKGNEKGFWCFMGKEIKNAPTIIEADREREKQCGRK